MKRKTFDIYDQKLLRHLIDNEPGNTNKLSNETGMSWGAAARHLKKLADYGYVVKEDNIWRLTSKAKAKIKKYS
jgi:predicted transcriptional regulator